MDNLQVECLEDQCPAHEALVCVTRPIEENERVVVGILHNAVKHAILYVDWYFSKFLKLWFLGVINAVVVVL